MKTNVHAGQKRSTHPEAKPDDESVQQPMEKRKQTTDLLLRRIAEEVHASDAFCGIFPLAELVAAYAEPPKFPRPDQQSPAERAASFHRLDDLFALAGMPSSVAQSDADELHARVIKQTTWLTGSWPNAFRFLKTYPVKGARLLAHQCVRCASRCWPTDGEVEDAEFGFWYPVKTTLVDRDSVRACAQDRTGAVQNTGLDVFMCKLHNPAGRIDMRDPRARQEANDQMVLFKHTREWYEATL
jgi:hypothetical protein